MQYLMTNQVLTCIILNKFKNLPLVTYEEIKNVLQIVLAIILIT